MANGTSPDAGARSSLARKARELVVREDMLPPGSRVLVMLSGGQDSVALLHLLASGDIGRAKPESVYALHVNHHLRGEESVADETLAAEMCARLGIELTVVHRPIDKAAGNVQVMARSSRKEAALQAARERESDRVALGHTRDDQVETMLYRLGRYGGLPAFRGMMPCDPPWIRPLLGCRRRETEEYCRGHGLVFADDRGNMDPGYARTGIRGRVVPAWETVLPGAVDAAGRAAEVAGEIEAVAMSALADATARVGQAQPDSARTLSASKLAKLLPGQRRLFLYQWLQARGSFVPSRSAVLAVEALLGASGSAECSLTGGWWARKQYDLVWLEQGSRAGTVIPPPEELSLPGETQWAGIRIRAEHAENFFAPDPTREAYIDVRALDAPLWVRGAVSGDRLRPLGAPGSRKLQDVFVDLRVPAAERPLVPLVVSGERVVWVCGLVVAEEGRIRADTTAIARLSASSSSDGLDSPATD